MEKKIGYARKRAMEEAGEVEMKDVVDSGGKAGKSDRAVRGGKGDVDIEMDGLD